MDVLMVLFATSFALSAYAAITARRAERHTRLQPKMDIRRYEIAPNDFLAITPERELSMEEAIRIKQAIKSEYSKCTCPACYVPGTPKHELSIVIMPPNSQISVIRKLPGFSPFTEVRQEPTREPPQYRGP